MKPYLVASIAFAFGLFLRWYSGDSLLERTAGNAAALVAALAIAFMAYCLAKGVEE